MVCREEMAVLAPDWMVRPEPEEGRSGVGPRGGDFLLALKSIKTEKRDGREKEKEIGRNKSRKEEGRGEHDENLMRRLFNELR